MTISIALLDGHTRKYRDHKLTEQVMSEQMNAGRRKALQFLGLTGAVAAGTAVHIENLFSAEQAATGQDMEPAKFAAALENLASAIRKGEARTSLLNINSSLVADEICKHTLTIEFIFSDQFKPVA